MKRESVQEIHRKILERMNIGVDNVTGSYNNVLAGSVAASIYDLEENGYAVKTQANPLANDVESVALTGRSIGLFIYDATPAEIEIQTSSQALAENERIVAVSTKQEFIVRTILGDYKYHLESVDRGSAATAIPYKWYSEVVFAPTEFPTNTFTARVTQILVPGRDEEEPKAFRTRVYAAHMTRPFCGNPAWFTAFLTQTYPGIGCVRLQQTRFLTGQNHAQIKIFIGDEDLAPVTPYTLKGAKAGLNDTLPVGMEYLVESVVRLDTVNLLKIDIAYGKLFGMYLIPDLVKNTVIDMLQENFRNLAKNTFPLDPIRIDVPALQGRVGNILAANANGVEVKVTYQNKEHTDVFTLDPSHVPWATDTNVQIHAKGEGVQSMDPEP